MNTFLSRNSCPVSKPGLSPDWDEIPAFLKLPGFIPDRKNQHGLTLADVPAWLHEKSCSVHL